MKTQSTYLTKIPLPVLSNMFKLVINGELIPQLSWVECKTLLFLRKRSQIYWLQVSIEVHSPIAFQQRN